MKKARTKKLRGLKRKSPRDPAEAREKQAHSQTIAQKTAQRAPQNNKSTDGQVTKVKFATKNERPTPTRNILKARRVPQQTMHSNESNGATTNVEVDRWISLIREGGLDRKVKVKGKTGALLVR